MPGGDQALLHPRRRLADLDVLDDARRRSAGRGRGRRSPPCARPLIGLPRRRVLDRRARAHVCAGQRRHLAGDAEHREQVRPVRRELDVEDVSPRTCGQRRADRRVLGQDEDALVLVGEAELLLGADHARGLDAADLRRLEHGRLAGVAVDQPRADARRRRPSGPAATLGAPQTTVRLLAAPMSTVARTQAVGVGVRLDLRRRCATTTPSQSPPVVMISPTSTPAMVRRRGQLRRGRGSGQRIRRASFRGTRIGRPQNWRRKRRSLA